MKILFFGSSSDSVLVLQNLTAVVAVVTQPPRPVGRKHIVTPTPVELWARRHKITVLSFPTKKERPWEYENKETVIDTLQPLKAELIVSASYGQKIPSDTISDAKFGGLNVHPSLLPRWRGTDPVPWTILAGDHQTGVTIVTLSNTFDQGKIIAQKKFPVSPTDETEPLRAKLFAAGADLLSETLPHYLSGAIKGRSQNNSEVTYARRLTREDGYIPWDIIVKAMNGEDVAVDVRTTMLSLNKSHIAIVIATAVRALSPWPGVWTKHNNKRLKILACHVKDVTNNLVLDTVHAEGKKPTSNFSP